MNVEKSEPVVTTTCKLGLHQGSSLLSTILRISDLNKLAKVANYWQIPIISTSETYNLQIIYTLSGHVIGCCVVQNFLIIVILFIYLLRLLKHKMANQK